MLLWFGTLGVLGVKEILRAPEVLVALDPTHAVRFFATDGLKGFLVLGSVVLVVTGGEAIYADMGHFGARPIRVAWFALVLPALLLNYFGQGALLLRSPQALENPLFEMVPPWGVLPMVVLATAATTIASQALISGVFSLTRQAVQLRFLPRLTGPPHVRDRAGADLPPGRELGPPRGLHLLRRRLRLLQPARRGVRRRGHVDDAPDDAPLLRAARRRLEGRALEGGAPRRVFLVDRARLLRRESREARARRLDSARARRGRLHAARHVEAGTADRRGTAAEPGVSLAAPVEEYVQQVETEDPPRFTPHGHLPGALSRHRSAVPPPEPAPQRRPSRADRAVDGRDGRGPPPPACPPRPVEALGAGFFRVQLAWGFMEEPDIPAALAEISLDGASLDPDGRSSYFLGRDSVISTARASGMARWRERLFAWMRRNERPAAAYFRIPPTGPSRSASWWRSEGNNVRAPGHFS